MSPGSYERLKAEGKCVKCCNPRGEAFGVLCLKCEVKNRAVALKRYKDRRAMGLCMGCPNPSPLHTLCDTCRPNYRTVQNCKYSRRAKRERASAAA
jgi:hypothetical protein